CVSGSGDEICRVKSCCFSCFQGYLPRRIDAWFPEANIHLQISGFTMTLKKLRSGARLFRQALVGSSTINYTEGSIARATFLLAVPMILEMSMESVFAIVDIFFVAGLGTEAVATVGLTEAVLALLYAVAIGLSMGTTALVARRIGENNPAAAAIVAGQAVWVGIFVSVLVGLIGFFYAGKILQIMGASPEVVETGES